MHAETPRRDSPVLRCFCLPFTMAGQDPAIQRNVSAPLDGRLLAAHGEKEGLRE